MADRRPILRGEPWPEGISRWIEKNPPPDQEEPPRSVFDEDYGATLDEMLLMPASVKCKIYACVA